MNNMTGIDMRQYISQRLGEMKSIDEKDMLRELMEGIFVPLYDQTQAQFEQLKTRVMDEMPLDTEAFAIWTTLVPHGINNNPNFYPMLEEDLLVPPIKIDGLQERLRAEGEIRLDSVFVQADYLACKEMADSREIYEGTINAPSGTIAVGIRLRLSKRYAACFENLYKLFVTNGIPWQTVNAPYVFKMFDVMLVRVSPYANDKDAFASGYTASFGKYDSYIQKGLVPMWNVEQLELKSEDFPLATLDKLNYEYAFDLTEPGAEHGYLADYRNASIFGVRREENTLIVSTPEKRGLTWNIFKVAKRIVLETDAFPYELMNNAQRDSFAVRMMACYGTVIKSHAELQRLIEAYDVCDYIMLDSVQVVPSRFDGDTYEVNEFIKDEIRSAAVHQSLLLKFKPVKKNAYILRDIMSFLVSQVQIIYPDFYCVGVLI